MQEGTLNLIRGDDQEVGLTITESDGSAYNLSGCYWIFSAKENIYNPNYLIHKSGNSHIAPESGISEIVFQPSDTASLGEKKYYFDIKLFDTGSKITTLVFGDMLIYPR